jgi:hypothetical protein
MWSEGEVILRRGVLNDGRAWIEVPEIVVRDGDELLATYVPEGTPFRFPEGPWPTPTGLHPWHSKQRWQGHGIVVLQRPGEMHAIWVFWRGEQREFAGWYVNIQEPFRRTALGYDTLDLELDIWLPRDGAWERKDDELLEERVREGRFTPAQVAAARVEASRVIADIDAGHQWWDRAWSEWKPDPAWQIPRFPDTY